MLGVQVQGGSDAGRRVVREREPWPCNCRQRGDGPNPDPRFVPRTHAGNVYSCPDCHERRP